MSALRLTALVCAAFAMVPLSEPSALKPVAWAEPKMVPSSTLEVTDSAFQRGRQQKAQGVEADGSIANIPDRIGSMHEDTAWMDNQLDYNEDQLTKSRKALDDLKAEGDANRDKSEKLSQMYKDGLSQLHQMDTNMNTQKVFLQQSGEAVMQLKGDEEDEKDKTSVSKKKLDKMLSNVTHEADHIFGRIEAASKEEERFFTWSFMTTDRINSNSNTLHTMVHELYDTDSAMDRLTNNMITLISRVNKANEYDAWAAAQDDDAA